MLTLVLGRAGSGKTMYAMKEIKEKGEAGERNLLLIVPEQYSHDAEKQLSMTCGDGLSIYGEVLSFSSLCRYVFSKTGGAPSQIIDSGGQILLMHRALEELAPQLRAYGGKSKRTDLLEKLLDTVKEFKNLRIFPETLNSLAQKASKALRDKLQDLSLIFSGYDALLHSHGCDGSDRLALLAEMIQESDFGEFGHIYFDGFNDFTEQELRIIEELVKKNAKLTICLTCDRDDYDSDVFELPRKTTEKLTKLASSVGATWDIRNVEDLVPMITGNEKADELVYLERSLFSHSSEKYNGNNRAIEIFTCPTRYAECEQVAYTILKLVREEGYRWRDIGVMARNWEDYGPICENILEKYEVPFFSSGRADILDKPPLALIDSALEIAVLGWEYKSIFRYLKSGLTVFSTEDCALLENYVIKWSIKGTTWTREWTLPPLDNGNDNENKATLARINNIRHLVTLPLIELRSGLEGVTEARDKLETLYAFLENIKLPECLANKADLLDKRNETRMAEEYSQLWEVIRNAMEQFYVILGDVRVSAADFRKLFELVLSRYDVGVIPVSLDRVALGSMAMSRRRDLKCLIVLGATDENIPQIARSNGALSEHEREELSGLGAALPAGNEERYIREMNMLYSTLTLPSEKLIITLPTNGDERPSFIVKRLMSMFGIDAVEMEEEECMTAALIPCFELAMTGSVEISNKGRSAAANAAKTFFDMLSSETSQNLKKAEVSIHSGRGSLSVEVARKLYGHEPVLSATRLDRYYSCQFRHFLYNGLHLNPRSPVEFDAPTAGIFTHYVLEGVSREIKGSVGYKNADYELCQKLAQRFIEQYIQEELYGFEGKTSRFIYLFKRLEDNVFTVVLDMLQEMKASEFEPLDFELNFSEFMQGDYGKGSIHGLIDEESDPGCTLSKTGDGGSGDSGADVDISQHYLNLGGIVDRVDGWVHDGKLFLRVVDYKTGTMPFNLYDVLYGRNMQMLIYLFALEKFGAAKYSMNVAPAGVLYIPARDVILPGERNESDDDISKKRENKLRRSGLLFNDPIVIEAMEKGESKKYLPVKTTKNGIAGDSLVNEKQFQILSNHVAKMLDQAANDILNGKIDCLPQYINSTNNACLYCEYRAVCAFDENLGDRRTFISKLNAREVWELLEDLELE